MMTAKIQDAINKQINAELYSSYLYLSMSAHFQSVNLQGMTNWMRIQAWEELQHALKFYDFMNERGGKVVLTKLEGPPTEWDSPLQIFEQAYQHECMVTGLINDIVDLSAAEKDHATTAFLQWYVTEQVEEEASPLEIVERLRLAEGQAGALFMIDNEVGTRIVNPGITPTGMP